MAAMIWPRQETTNPLAIFEPPPGVNPQYDNPPGSLALLSLILFPLSTAISLTFVGFRIFYSWSSMRRLTADDWCILPAAVFATTQVALVLTKTQFARHSWDIRLSWFDGSYFKILIFSQNLMAFSSLLFSKLSIFLLFLRIFVVKVYMRYAIYAGMFWTVITYLPFLITTSYLCAPHVGQKWNLETGQNCDKGVDWEITSGAMAVLLDIYILVLPMPLLWKMSLPMRRKLGIVLVFTTASLALVCATLTLVYRVHFKKGGDLFYNSWKLVITAVIENNVAITVACMPGAAAFVKKYIMKSPSLQPSRPSHLALKSIGGTSLKSSEEIYLRSTTHLSGWRHSKDGRVYTEITNRPEMPERARLRNPDSISRIVDFDQRSTRGIIEDAV